MLPEGAVAATHIWKRFRADRRRKQLREAVARLHARLRGRPDRGWRWALRDVELLAGPGESVGLVGINGSGKTTLLKIVARVMYPYAGRVETSGRIGALIQVKAGLHPYLSGRENVSLSGSILGLGRRDVARRFDDIVAFAELEDAVERQVKYYSSGMQMRLGFAIAAFLEPDILLVDEVLAVGDAAFQQRCLERIREVLTQGTTLVYVSHDLPTVEATCARGLWLRDGVVEADGPVGEVLAGYRRHIEESAEASPRAGALVRVMKAQVTAPGGGLASSLEPLDVTVVLESVDARSGILYLGLTEGPATPIFVVRRDLSLPGGEVEVRCSLSRLPLPRGRYYVWLGLLDEKGHDLLGWHPAAHIDVVGPVLDKVPVVRLAPVHVEARWEIERR